MARMARMFARIDLMEVAANRTYRLVLERYPKSTKLLRSYGRFLENVKNDPWAASKYYAEAEKQVRARRAHTAGPTLHQQEAQAPSSWQLVCWRLCCTKDFGAGLVVCIDASSGM